MSPIYGPSWYTAAPRPATPTPRACRWHPDRPVHRIGLCRECYLDAVEESRITPSDTEDATP